jgi:hypothetical protein
LDDVGDVRPREGELLERGDQASVGRRVGDQGPVVLRELCLSVFLVICEFLVAPVMFC